MHKEHFPNILAFTGENMLLYLVMFLLKDWDKYLS